MDDSNFNTEIKLNQFQNDFFKSMNTFRKDNLFCDVSLDVQGKRFPCHRLVLSMSSPYFQAMFSGGFKESKSEVVVMGEVEAEIMDQILNAVYTAHIQLTPANVFFILKASHFLQFNAIVDTCVACIMKKPQICYLIETCLFTRNVALPNLHKVCVRAIRKDLLRWSKTESFEKLPFEIFNSILSKGNSIQNEYEVLMLINKWSKSNNVTSEVVQILLRSSKFDSPINGSSVIAELISNVGSTEDIIKNPTNRFQPNSDFSFNLYLNAVDVKTGAAGCGVLKLNRFFEFDEHTTLSNFHTTNSFYTKICIVDSITYCLEFDNFAKKFIFSCWENTENSNKTELQVHEDLHLPTWNNERGFDIVAIENMMYLFLKPSDDHVMNDHGQRLKNSWVWRYDCERNTWKNMSEEIGLLMNFDDWCAVTSVGSAIYLIGVRKSYNYAWQVTKEMMSFDIRFPTSKTLIAFPNPSIFKHKYASVCTFDDKIAISSSNFDGVSDTSFYIFNARTKRWLRDGDIKPMKNGGVNHKLIYRDGFIYAVGNSPFVKNEKYNVHLNSWSDFPSLPKQLVVKNAEGGDMVVSTGYVLYGDTNRRVVLID